MVVVSVQAIAAGEEVLTDYGDLWWQEFEKRRQAARRTARRGAG